MAIKHACWSGCGSRIYVGWHGAREGGRLQICLLQGSVVRAFSDVAGFREIGIDNRYMVRQFADLPSKVP